jgi:hypothetical protein
MTPAVCERQVSGHHSEGSSCRAWRLPPRPSSDSCLEKRQTITLREHAVFDPDQLLLDRECPGLGGKQLQGRAITQRGFGLAQPGRGIRGLSSEDLLGAGRDARNTDSLIGFFRRLQLPGGFAAVQGAARLLTHTYPRVSKR